MKAIIVYYVYTLILKKYISLWPDGTGSYININIHYRGNPYQLNPAIVERVRITVDLLT